ncbi:MAG TPA: hypothetical protein VFC52_06045 [Solirubrobacterales bacterium]|nr:hypothetical protein [Solirubrobacterales bacterium]
MDWENDPELGLLFGDIAGLGKLYALERVEQIELWRVPPAEVIDEDGIEIRHFGPIRVSVNRARPHRHLFNLILGADRLGAAADGHLAEALAWVESLGLDCRLPLRRQPEFGESGAAEDHLNHRGYRRTGAQATWVRGLEPPDFQPPAGVEVEELVDESNAETFGIFLEAGYGDAGWVDSGVFVGLPGQREWRCYLASDESGTIAAGAMLMHYEMPQLVFAGNIEETRGRGACKALLRRCIEDVRVASQQRRFSVPDGIFAFTDEPLGCPDDLSPGARNLVHAGFRLVDVRDVWQPPEELIAEEDAVEDEDEDEDEDDAAGML